MGKGKPRGLLAARKLRNNRREQQWADLHYKKRLLGTAYKSSPFGVRTIHITARGGGERINGERRRVSGMINRKT
jgi:hypothetical protein